MGNIGSHVDLTSGRRGHQAKPASAVEFLHTRNSCFHQQVISLTGSEERVGHLLHGSADGCRAGSAAAGWAIAEKLLDAFTGIDLSGIDVAFTIHADLI